MNSTRVETESGEHLVIDGIRPRQGPQRGRYLVFAVAVGVGAPGSIPDNTLPTLAGIKPGPCATTEVSDVVRDPRVMR